MTGPRTLGVLLFPGFELLDVFGPLDGGEPIQRADGVGIMPDGRSLASGVVGMDDSLRTFVKLTGVPLVEAVRMASLTPARIAGMAHQLGSITPGKRADLVFADDQLHVRQVYVAGSCVYAEGGR